MPKTTTWPPPHPGPARTRCSYTPAARTMRSPIPAVPSPHCSQVHAGEPAGGVLGGLPGHDAHHPGRVAVAALMRFIRPPVAPMTGCSTYSDVDEVFQIQRPANQAVQVVEDDPVDDAAPPARARRRPGAQRERDGTVRAAAVPPSSLTFRMRGGPCLSGRVAPWCVQVRGRDARPRTGISYRCSWV